MRTRRRSTKTMCLLLLWFFAILMPSVSVTNIVKAQEASVDASLHENEMEERLDIFNGRFSPLDISAIPNQVVDVSFSLSPIMDVPETAVQFFIPCDFIKLVKGESVWCGDVKRDETVTLQLSIVPVVESDVCIRVDVKTLALGKEFSSSYSLRVNSMNPATRADASCIRVSPPSEAQVTPMSSSGEITITGRFEYINDRGGRSPMRAVLVKLFDDDTGDDYEVDSTYTDSSGDFSFTVNNDDEGGRDPYVEVYSEGQYSWKTTQGSGIAAPYSARAPNAGDDVPDGFSFDYGTLVPAAFNEAWMAGDAIQEMAFWIWNQVSWGRSTVDIAWPQGDWPHAHEDIIELPQNPYSNNRFTWTHQTVYHEYGHCVMYSLWNGWPSSDHMFENHILCSEKDGGFALIEGWAAFFEAAVDNNPSALALSGYNIENNHWYNIQVYDPDLGWQGDTGEMDGNEVEGSVASILWDIFDPINDKERDILAFGGFYEIFWTVKTRTRSIDDMIDFFYEWSDPIHPWSHVIGALSNIYWNYGINVDFYWPYGNIYIDDDAPYTNNRNVGVYLDLDDWGSGVGFVRFSEDFGNTWSNWKGYQYQGTKVYHIDSPDDGPKCIDVQFQDMVGHISSASDWIILDTTAPVTTISRPLGSSSFSLPATDLWSGVWYTCYRIDGGPWITYVDAFKLTDAGIHTIDYYSKDNAGNAELFKTITALIAPMLCITGESPVNILVTDPDGFRVGYDPISGVLNEISWASYSGPGTEPQEIRIPNPVEGTYRIDAFGTGTGAFTITVESFTADGSLINSRTWTSTAEPGEQYSQEIEVEPDGAVKDATPPTTYVTLEGTLGSNGWYTSSVIVTLEATDDMSGIAATQYSLDNVAWMSYSDPFTIEDDGIYTVYFLSIDNDGNTEASQTISFKIDQHAPATTLSIGEPKHISDKTYVTLDTPFTLKATDTISGVYSIAYRIYDATYDSGWQAYTAPFKLTLLTDGTYTIEYKSTDKAGNVEISHTVSVVLDNSGPTAALLNPPSGWALQDGVTFLISAADVGSGVHSVNASIRIANGGEGQPCGFDDLPATYNEASGKWMLFFDTLQLPDGYYSVLIETDDNLRNQGISVIVPYSIRNWAVIELLPSSVKNKAGRTMPVKFSLRVAAAVDPSQPFVYNEELTIKIYAANNPSNVLQTSTYGNGARNYRIDVIGEKYITNFKTLPTPKQYTVSVNRNTFVIGSFNFQTVP